MDCTCQAPLSFTISQSLLKFIFIESVMLSNHLIFCCPLLLLPSIFPSIRIFFIESALHIRWPKYWSFSISPSNEYSGLISFKIDWFDFLVVQRALESLLQHHSSQASILRCSAFFMVQISHSYMFTGKTIALNIQTLVSKVMSLVFDMLSRFVTASKEQASFNFKAVVTVCSDFGALENKICHCFHFPPSFCHEVGTALMNHRLVVSKKQFSHAITLNWPDPRAF